MTIDNFSRIPKKRGTAAEIALASVAIILFLIGIYFNSNNNILNAFGINITVYPLVVMTAEILHRICLICEELWHVPSRYTSRTHVFMHGFTFSKRFIGLYVILLFTLIFVWQAENRSPFELIYLYGPSSIFCLLGTLLFITLLKPKAGPLYQAIAIGNLNGLDYGSAMAYSFFHGYLQIVLPHKGTDQKGIKEMIHDFEAKEGVTFSCDRLLVLIPLSLHCPATVEQEDNSVELAKSLPEINLSRAGVNRRSYKNTAYKIRVNETEKAYVCLEYATPLQTLFDIIKHRSEHANDYAVQQRELALQFYLTVQSLVRSDPDCRHCCDLIFFDDKTKDGENVDVGLVVLDHIRKYNKKCNRRTGSELQDVEQKKLITNVGT